MRALSREHTEALRRERQLATSELNTCRERAEDAERRLDMMRHAGQMAISLEPRGASSPPPTMPSLLPPPPRPPYVPPPNEEAADAPWHALRKQQEANAQRLDSIRRGTGGGASAALLRRAGLAEAMATGTPPATSAHAY